MDSTSRNREQAVKRFACNLLALRRRAGLTQEELACRAGLHRIEIGYLEHRRRLPRLDTLVRLCQGLEVSPNELLEGVEWKRGQVDH